MIPGGEFVAVLASSDTVDMRSQTIMPRCFTSCFMDPRNIPLLLAIRENHENSHAEAVKMLIANGASSAEHNVFTVLFTVLQR